ncbi:MAG: phosphatidylserine decarboxylase [Planctomycetota bacterium]|nr:phosphatidylserine decarboxylase [Planctomycetota bacterium]
MWRRLRLTEYGRDEIVILTAACLLTGAGLWIAFGPWPVLFPAAALTLTLQFFRDPERVPPDDPDAWTSPADGRVADVVETVEMRYIGGPARRVGIFMSPFDVHVNRSPADGTVEYLSYEPGRFLDARRRESSEKNESQWIGIRTTPYGTPIVVRQISGVIARRIVCALNAGDRVSRGGRFGMVKFGSRVEIYVPAEAPVDIVVEPGRTVRAGATVIARLRRCHPPPQGETPSAGT